MKLAHALIDEAAEHGFTLKLSSYVRNRTRFYRCDITPSPTDFTSTMAIEGALYPEAALIRGFEMAVGRHKTRRVKPAIVSCPQCKGKGGKATIINGNIGYEACITCTGQRTIRGYVSATPTNDKTIEIAPVEIKNDHLF